MARNSVSSYLALSWSQVELLMRDKSTKCSSYSQDPQNTELDSGSPATNQMIEMEREDEGNVMDLHDLRG